MEKLILKFKWNYKAKHTKTPHIQNSLDKEQSLKIHSLKIPNLSKKSAEVICYEIKA